MSEITDEQIKAIGTSSRKIGTIRELTRRVQQRELDLYALEGMDDKSIIEHLTRIKGIGVWTAKMVLIFALDRQDVLPDEDVAFLQGFHWAYGGNNAQQKDVRLKCKKWHPYASIAARYMYRALDMGLTKETFHLYK